MILRTLFRVGGWACLAAIALLSVVSPGLRPVTNVPHDLEHALIFALAGYALMLGYPGRLLWRLAAVTAFAAAVELVQFFSPGRHPTLRDFAVDAASACAGVLLAALVIQLWKLRVRRG